MRGKERKNSGITIPVSCSYRNVSIEKNVVELTHPDVLIDLGSIAKGYITDRIVEALKERGVKECLVNARGDIRVSGNYEHVFGVQDPRSSATICWIKLKNQSVATSGDYKQFVKTFDKSHILNQKELSSVTVVAPTLEEADGFASVIFVTSKKLREQLIKKHSKLKVLTIVKEQRLKAYNHFEKLMVKEHA